jgi:hypothetical protein
MRPASSLMRTVAERLIAHESKGKRVSTPGSPVAVQICMKLRPHLATLMGAMGFRALLSRALALASAEVAWLSALRVQSDGTLDGMVGLEEQVEPDDLADGGVVLLAQLLGLLAVFIGDKLTLRIVADAWPKLPLHDLDSGTGR